MSYPRLTVKSDDLRSMRLRAGLTQSDLAKKSGVTASTVSHMEQPGARAHPGTVRKVAAALDVNVDTIARVE